MKSSAVESNEVYDTLVSASRLAGSLDVDGRNFRPCIAKMMEAGLEKGSFPDRSTGAVIIASELRRLGKQEDFVASYLIQWNQKNRPPKRISEIRSAINSAFRKEYRYSCHNVALEQLCIGKDLCSHARLTSQSRKYTNNRKFIQHGWQNLLSNSATLLYYLAIIELERRLGVGPGGRVIANHRKLAKLAGITAKTVGKALSELAGTPLIAHFKMGKPRKWEGRATEIRRTIPIPGPPVELVRSWKKYASQK